MFNYNTKTWSILFRNNDNTCLLPLIFWNVFLCTINCVKETILLNATEHYTKMPIKSDIWWLEIVSLQPCGQFSNHISSQRKKLLLKIWFVLHECINTIDWLLTLINDTIGYEIVEYARFTWHKFSFSQPEDENATILSKNMHNIHK